MGGGPEWIKMKKRTKTLTITISFSQSSVLTKYEVFKPSWSVNTTLSNHKKANSSFYKVAFLGILLQSWEKQ